MPLLRVFLFGFLLAAPPQALAGPWLRAEGETFLSYAIETEFENGVTDGSELFATFYAERGLTDRLTLGLDAGRHPERFGKIIGFLRWPVGNRNSATQIAAEFGMGFAKNTFALRPGISWGKGFQAGQTPGWLTVESRALVIDSFDGVFETDVTVGLSPTPRSKVIMQLQTGIPSDNLPYAKFAPSYVHQVGPGHHVELGFVIGVSEADDFKMKFGFWRKF